MSGKNESSMTSADQSQIRLLGLLRNNSFVLLRSSSARKAATSRSVLASYDCEERQRCLNWRNANCESENPKARARGLNDDDSAWEAVTVLSVLAQLGAGKPDAERPFTADCVSIAIDHLRDPDDEAVRCAAWALSHLCTHQAVLALIAVRNHPDSDVRHAVACCIELRKHPEAVGIVVALMEDSNEVVRDWATFALGSSDIEKDGVLRYIDSPAIRAALRNRLEDSYEDARREAIWGLARRNDPLGMKLLLNHLESEEWWKGDKDAAEELLGLELDTPVEEVRDGLRRLLV